MNPQKKESSETGFWSPARINSRIDAYTLGVGARVDGTTLGVNPFNLEQAPEQWAEWRQGWLDGRSYQTGPSKVYFIRD